MMPDDWQDAVLRTHGDFYTRHESGFVHLYIEEGRVSLRSLNRAPFGVEPQLDVTGFAPLERTQLARI